MIQGYNSRIHLWGGVYGALHHSEGLSVAQWDGAPVSYDIFKTTSTRFKFEDGKYDQIARCIFYLGTMPRTRINTSKYV
jgi:hypothetical protein